MPQYTFQAMSDKTRQMVLEGRTHDAVILLTGVVEALIYSRGLQSCLYDTETHKIVPAPPKVQYGSE